MNDFIQGADLLVFDRAAFSGIAGYSAGALAPDAIGFGAAATTATQRFIYDAANGLLSYDEDGNGANSAIQIALILGAPMLDATDFLLV